jgi:hypothetical protein
MKHNGFYYAVTALALSAGYIGLNSLPNNLATTKLSGLPDKALQIPDTSQSVPHANTELAVTTIDSNTSEKLLVETEQRALGDILRDVETKTNIHFILTAQTANKIISKNLKGVNLEMGLQALFQGMDTFYQFTSTKSSPVHLTRVWVYPLGEAEALTPAASLASDSKSYRISGLVEAKTNCSEQTNIPIQPVADKAINALQSNNPNVRLQVLTQFQHSGLTLPRDVLEKLLISDDSDKIRQAALLSIAASPGVTLDELKQDATNALNDNSESVRNVAKDLLDKIEAGVNAPQPSDDEGGAV